MDIKELLKKETVAELEALEGIEIGSEQYKTTVDGISKLVDRQIEMDKLENAAENEKQEKNENVHKWVGYALRLVEIAAPIGLVIWGTKVSMKFEDPNGNAGMITSTAGRSFMSRLFRGK